MAEHPRSDSGNGEDPESPITQRGDATRRNISSLIKPGETKVTILQRARNNDSNPHGRLMKPRVHLLVMLAKSTRLHTTSRAARRLVLSNSQRSKSGRVKQTEQVIQPR